jgi:hypothetical protein
MSVIDADTFRHPTLIARAAGIPHGEAITLLAEHFQRSADPAQLTNRIIAVHATPCHRQWGSVGLRACVVARRASGSVTVVFRA